MVLGDLNEFYSRMEKLSAHKDNSTGHDNFNNFINSNNLIDVSFLDNPFTWHNRREKYAAVFSRLDRALINHLWIRLYPFPYIEHLPIIGCDQLKYLIYPNN